MKKHVFTALLLVLVPGMLPARATDDPLTLVGVSVNPHLMLDTMRYAKPPEPPDGALVTLFLRNDSREPVTILPDTPSRINSATPDALLESGDIAWHDFPGAHPDLIRVISPGGLTTFTFNGRRKPYGTGGNVPIQLGPENQPIWNASVPVENPDLWISAVTFFAPENAILPDEVVIHVANETNEAVTLDTCALWIADNPARPWAFKQEVKTTTLTPFGGNGVIPPHDRGGFSIRTRPLPRTNAVVELVVRRPHGEPRSIWAKVRVKPEVFDISGGWVGGANILTREPCLKTLKLLHVNTGHIGITPGYSDTELYAKYPIKYFGELKPWEQYDTDEMLPRIHGAEFLGEPQYGGGRPVPPQEVWRQLLPYATTRFATTLTHSEERIWRDYAGLSDFPHYDAYRVTAPSPDLWIKYADRWGGKKIAWGAPLETIGDMCRSLRELNRPAPCAYWSQGPSSGWGMYGGRRRTTPTPDEIRLQAYHALSTRLTSLYWFNLSFDTLVKWRDTLDELRRCGREMRVMAPWLLWGDAFDFQRLRRADGALDWDTASVCAPDGALLFALDLDYTPDLTERVFRFGAPRDASWTFRLPGWLRGRVVDVFRFDADGVYDVTWTRTEDGVNIADRLSRVGVYFAVTEAGTRAQVATEREKLVAEEQELGFDPIANDADFAVLESIQAETKEK
ncbi:MAG TPA: hypothetical protein PK379_04770 [Candidatus Hydrogenedentes bacterium]|nr:hypothetical protein [Candidatus Hydrogenedentota bacterium]